jgi:murein DD-endopeptidase MepM/ murein hydrolase activator NlpD
MRFGVVAGLAALCLSGAGAVASTCTAPGDAGSFAFVCPVAGGGQVRAGDVCAREGGGVHANRGAGRQHNGLDINSPEGTSVFAARAGRVALAARNWGALGNTVIIDHEDGEYTVYGHLRQLRVRRNACVQAGDLVGNVGYTGNAVCLKQNHLSSHLHFAVIRASRPGLIDRNGPLAAAIKTNDRWSRFAKLYFAAAGLGIQNPEAVLGSVAGCLR